MKKLVSIGAAALMLGVAVSTLRRWDGEGIFCPDGRTQGGHRRYAMTRLLVRSGRQAPTV